MLHFHVKWTNTLEQRAQPKYADANANYDMIYYVTIVNNDIMLCNTMTFKSVQLVATEVLIQKYYWSEHKRDS